MSCEWVNNELWSTFDCYIYGSGTGAKVIVGSEVFEARARSYSFPSMKLPFYADNGHGKYVFGTIYVSDSSSLSFDAGNLTVTGQGVKVLGTGTYE